MTLCTAAAVHYPPLFPLQKFHISSGDPNEKNYANSHIHYSVLFADTAGGSGGYGAERMMTTGNGYWLYVTEEGVLTGLTA